MNRFRLFAVCLIIILICWGSFGIAGQETGETLCIPIGNLTLAPPESVEARRSPVEFPHSSHFGYNCETCHHQWEYTEDLYACKDCHDLTEPPQEPASADDAILYYKNAYHKLCIDCHRQIKQQNAAMALSGKVLEDKLKKTGPTGCIGCHPRE